MLGRALWRRRGGVAEAKALIPTLEQKFPGEDNETLKQILADIESARLLQ